jgi:hypothetical protein
MRAGDQLGTQSRELDRVREEFHRELMRKSMRIAELELELQETRLDYESSLSWRLTKPVRIRTWVRQRLAGLSGGP